MNGESFDLVKEQEIVRHMINQAGLYKFFEDLARKYDAGLISKVIYDEMRDLIFERMRTLQVARNAIEGLQETA